jgi:outer membrane protein assembly factor BamC
MNFHLYQRVFLTTIFVFSLVACDTISEKRRVDYKSSGVGARTEPLTIPPELGSIEQSDRYGIPGESEATFSKYSKEKELGGSGKTTNLLPEVPDIKIGREGTYRWLIVDRPAEDIWPIVTEFWMGKGFLIADQSPITGIIETDWAEDTSKTSPGRLQAFMERIIPGLSSNPERDKFWTRIERLPNGETEIFVSHEAMRQQVSVTPTIREVRWVDSPRDPNVEAKMLYELMLYLGMPDEAVAASGISSDSRPMSTIITVDLPNAKNALLVSGSASKVWDRVGIVLLSIGASVESREEESGLYYVRYHDPDGKNLKKGIERLKFWKDEKITEAAVYQISVTGDAETSMVIILDETGQEVSADTANRILAVLQEKLG